MRRQSYRLQLSKSTSNEPQSDEPTPLQQSQIETPQPELPPQQSPTNAPQVEEDSSQAQSPQQNDSMDHSTFIMMDVTKQLVIKHLL
uniref:Uncharacterized protein n=1 Tax=Nelumbo nucifera TaxID=4432 RepID=A0A822ZWT7_NELNU|nr:TPA_asm: hypothetical protein HUJ06_016325 [Nelumbo nucifera]